MSAHYISFPDLNIGPFLIDPVAFTVLGRDIMWYGIIICLGMILGVSYVYFRMKKNAFTEDEFFNLILFIVPISIISARLYYVIFDPTPNYKSFLDVIAIWRGGIGIYGAIIGGALTAIVYALVIKKPVYKLLDCIAPGVMIGQIIGRWGNFVNAEAHGSITSLPWRMGITPYHEALGFSESYTVYYHPTFLYESLWNLLGFVIIHFLITPRKRFDGQITLFYLSWYGFGRTFIELLRTDSLEIFGMKVSALVGLLSAIIFTALYIIKFTKKKRKNYGNNT